MSTPKLDTLLASISDSAPHSLIAAHLMRLVRELEEENALAKRDSERLDFLSRYASQPFHCCNVIFHNSEDMGYSVSKGDKPTSITIAPWGPHDDVKGRGETLRAAIDDAISLSSPSATGRTEGK